MRDPLRWQAGDGPMADWLTWVDEQLVGPQPDGYRLWGPGDYPQVVGTGYDTAGLAARFTAAGVTTLSVASVARVTGTTVVLGRVRIGGGWRKGRWLETTGRPVGGAG